MNTGNCPPLPISPPQWKHTAESITKTGEAAIKAHEAAFNKIAQIKPEECNFESVLTAMAMANVNFELALNPLDFMQYVSTEESVRDAAVELDKKTSEYSITSAMRTDIFEVLKAAEKNTDVSKLTSEQKRFLEKEISDRRRSGLDLSAEKREELMAKKKEISKLSVDFNRNCNEEKGGIQFTAEELEGVPEDSITGFPKSTDSQGREVHTMSFKTPDYMPVIDNAKRPETRKKALLGYEKKTEQNEPLFEQIMALRQECASILGYENWAAYRLEPKMAKTVATTDEFLSDLRKKVTVLGKEEVDTLMKLKEAESKELGIPFDNSFRHWDMRYLQRLDRQRTLDLDNEVTKQYFPVEHVIKEVLAIYQELLSLKFFKIEGAKLWHEEATQWAVFDADKLEQSQGSEGFLGFMHLDLFPRENKYGHAAVWCLIPGCVVSDGISYPIANMVANLAKPSGGKPALMQHNDVVTFFHELGHAFHGLCSRTQYSRFHGTHVERDFVEAPSQMLENWVFESSVLKRISKHVDTGKELPDDLIEKIIAARDHGQGLFNLRQLFFGTFDMRIHTMKDKPEKISELYEKMREDICLTDGEGTVSPGQTGFAHVIGGYDAGYYGYLWSQVYSADMYATIFEQDPMSKASGKLYREKVLYPGGSRNATETLKDFLGREPNNEAFMRKLFAGAKK